MNVIILSTQFNRYGGAATCAYELHKYFLYNKVNSYALFFDNSILGNESKYNQDELPNVYACKLLKNYLDEKIDLKVYNEIKKIIIEKTNNNFLMLGFNYLAPLIGKLMFPDKLMYYMVTGTCYINNSCISYGTDLINENFTQEYNLLEKKTIEISDYIIPNSNIMKNLITNIYEIIPNEVYDLHEIFENNIWENINLKEVLLMSPEKIHNLNYVKKYDLIFISSNFDRKVKNVDFAKEIFSNKSLENLKKIVVGKNSNKYFNKDEIKNLDVFDLVDQEKIIKLLKQSKIIIIPSFVESYSITCIEASNNICIPILSSNIGCNNFINNYYIIKTYVLKDWVNKILEINSNYLYHTKFFFNNYASGNNILNLIKKVDCVKHKKKVLFVTVDLPGIGGAATNTLNLINKFKDIWDIHTIFLDENSNKIIENLDNYVIIKNNRNVINNLFEYKKKLNFEFDFIFCKNYKCVIYVKNVFKKTNIVFSPSGIRIVMSILHKNYITDLKLEKLNNNLEYTNTNDLVNFIKDNDKILDFLAYNYSDIIIPNSKLTYDILNIIYKDENKIYNPIYTTNINYKKNNFSLDNFLNREFDIMFCCYSWARICKNLDLIIKIIEKLDEYKILLIGKKININDIKKYNNLTYIENVSNDEIKKYFEKSKVVVIPSYYDSNPNVLIEAVSFGCNVVTSKNVGNNEFLNENLVVNDHKNIDEWENKILNSLKIKYEYNGYDGDKVKLDLLKITNNINIKKITVGVYKINPYWDNLLPNKFEYFIYNVKKNDNFVNDVVFNDIYFILTYKLGITNGSNEINYIIVDESLSVNECYYVYNTICYFENYVKIWKIKNRNDLFYFNEADLYFLRGNYHKFYDIFIPKNSKVVFYPATSFKQNLDIKNVEPLKNKYSLVLVHENIRYKKLYLNNKRILFKKFTPDNFINLNYNRIYDFCFVATELQLTKNHNLFLNFVEYLDENNYNYNIIFVGNLNKITNDTNYCNKFKNVKLEFKINLSRNELIDIYNNSRNNMIFSGRDAFPRVMAESSACGCFNIVLDTLDDGISLCDGILGKIVGDDNVSKNFSGGSLSYKSDKILWSKIIKELEIKRDHNEISLKYRNDYNVENLIKQINNELNEINFSFNQDKIIIDNDEKNSLNTTEYLLTNS